MPAPRSTGACRLWTVFCLDTYAAHWWRKDNHVKQTTNMDQKVQAVLQGLRVVGEDRVLLEGVIASLNMLA